LLLDQWRSSQKDHMHQDILQQCENLLFILYLMSKNPDIQTKIKAELAENPYSMYRIDSLIYLNAVIRAGLRLSTPSIVSFRECEDG
jgi:cytochrome P450